MRDILEDLSLHILDIAENSINADARTIEIKIIEDLKKDLLLVEISDDGKGMDRAFADKATDPFVTTREGRRVGLGLSLFAEAARISNGRLSIHPGPQGGTTIEAQFQHSHIDRKPLGDIGQTIMTLVGGNPELDLVYVHERDEQRYRFDTKVIKARLGGESMNSPDGIKLIGCLAHKTYSFLIRLTNS
ncbi:ATP-binding protein [Candidatus Zixiibacteriota bacterium]